MVGRVSRKYIAHKYSNSIKESSESGLYIVACQRGGVSNKPPWAPGSDKTQGQGSFGPFTGGLDLPCRSGPPVDGLKDPWPRVLSLPEWFVGDPASLARYNISSMRMAMLMRT